MGSQQDYIVTGKHMSRCQVCGTRTVLTKEIFREGKLEIMSVCYNCQVNKEEALLKHLPRDIRTIPAVDATRQPPLEKWITMH